MTNSLVPLQGAALPAYLQPFAGAGKDLSQGVAQAFPTLSIKGRAFRIRHRGVETVLMRADGTGPLGAIEVVIVKSAPAVSKVFYKQGFKEGDLQQAPDCFSVDGIKPDPGAKEKQCDTCTGCQQNVWGSRVSTDGASKGKACSDNRRMAVVPAGDIENKLYGGTMMLRVPPTSLVPMATYGDQLVAQGIPYFGVATELTFDFSVAHPVLKARATRYLTQEEAMKIIELQKDPVVHRMLNEEVEYARAEVGTPGAPGVAQPAAIPTPASAPAPAPVPTAGFSGVSVQPAQPTPAQIVNPHVVPHVVQPQPVVQGLPGETTTQVASAFGQAAAPVVAPVAPVVVQPVVVQPVVPQPALQGEVLPPQTAQTSPPSTPPMDPEMAEFLAFKAAKAAGELAKARKPRTPKPSPAPADTTQPVEQVAPTQQVAQPMQVTQPVAQPMTQAPAGAFGGGGFAAAPVVPTPVVPQQAQPVTTGDADVDNLLAQIDGMV